MPGFYSVIVPVGDRRNLSTNPSFETGTTGWGTLFAGTLGTTSGVQAFGAWSGSVAPTSNGTAGVLAPTFAAGNGTAYSWSFYGSFPVGSTFIAGIGDSSGNGYQTGTLVGTGGGSWHRYHGSYTESTGATRRLAIRKNNSAVTTAFYIDAVQYEAGSVTTYIDGDQGVGYTWDGQPHASTSLRSASVRTGGSVYNLSDMGFTILDAQGVGMPDVNVVTQDYGYLDGGFYQRTRANVRSFVLTGLVNGTTWQHMHALRQQVINVIKPDLTPNPSPFRILYTGAGGSVQIDAVYDSGLSYGGWNGFAEQAAVRLIAPDPYWQTITERGTSLAAFTNLGSTNEFAYRDSYGRWGTLGQNGTTITSGAPTTRRVQSITISPTGTLVFGGNFGSIAGTANSAYIGFYAGGTFGTFPSSGITNVVNVVKYDASGTLYAGGFFISVDGRFQGLTQFSNNTWGSCANGTVDASSGIRGVYDLYPYGGTVFVAGNFTFAGPASAGINNYLALFTPTAWGSLGGGTVNNTCYALTMVGDTLVFTTDGGAAGGTTISNQRLGIWKNGAFGSVPGIISGVPLAGMYTVAALPSQNFVVGGKFEAVNSGSAPNVAQSNLSGFTRMALGIGSGTNDAVDTLVVSPAGQIWAGGQFFSSGTVLPFPDGIARWTGAAWVPGDIDIPPPGRVFGIAFTPDGGAYIAGSFTGTARSASVIPLTITNGAAVAPKIIFRAPTSGTTRIYQLLNTATQSELYFNLVLQANESAIVNLAPGSAGVTSSFRGNILSAIIAGSNLARWQLQPGTNYVSFFADNANLRTDITYRPRFWSNDGTS